MTNCSFNNSSNYWSSGDKIDLLQTIDKDLSFNEYKNKVLNYSNKSEFPDINN